MLVIFVFVANKVPLVIVVPSANFKPDAHKGTLRAIGPEEPRKAMLNAIRRDITASRGNQLKEWKKIILSTPCVLTVMSSEDDIQAQAITLRDEVVTAYHTCARTGLQRIYEIVILKVRKEKSLGMGNFTPRMVHEFYNTECNTSKFGEEISEDFCVKALSFHQRALQVAGVRDCIMRAEETYMQKSPFNNCSNMFAVVSKAGKDPTTISWVFNAILDACYNGDQEPVRVTFDEITGRKKHGRGLAALYKMKLQQREFMFQKGALMGFPPNIMSQLKTIFDSHASYRSHLKSYPTETSEPDLSWQQGWKPSACKFSELLEELVFLTDMEQLYFTAMRYGKGAEDVCSYKDVAEWLSDIQTCLSSERDSAVAPAGGVPPPPPPGGGNQQASVKPPRDPPRDPPMDFPADP
jgi:hypothetical protein